jgi:hypothetical protein
MSARMKKKEDYYLYFIAFKTMKEREKEVIKIKTGVLSRFSHFPNGFH